jgi:hypothetical protein
VIASTAKVDALTNSSPSFSASTSDIAIAMSSTST